MRRLLSLAILLVLALPLVAPALGQQAETRLLLCCRKGGMHQCMSAETSATPMLRTHCPAAPRVATTAPAGAWSCGALRLAAADGALVAPRVGQVEAGYRISFHRSRQKRGPPADRLS